MPINGMFCDTLAAIVDIVAVTMALLGLLCLRLIELIPDVGQTLPRDPLLVKR